jgi:tetratricopeptide (TPR) repeat protein
MSNVQREFLEKALRYYEDLAREEDEGPELSLERATANRRSAAILAKLERRPEAEAAYRRAIALLEGADIPGKAAELADSYSQLGFFLLLTVRKAEAQSAYHRALTLWESVPADEAAKPEVRYGRASTLNGLGMFLVNLGHDHDAESEPFFRQGLPLIRGLVAEFPREARYHGLLGCMLNNYGLAASRLGNPARACQYLNEAVAHQEEAIKLAPRDPQKRLNLRNHYSTLAAFPLSALKRYPEAIAAARKALTVTERLVSEFPNVPHYQRCLADTYGDLGGILNRSGQMPEAEEAYNQAVRIQERLVAADPNSALDRVQACILYTGLGGLKQLAGRGREAVGDYRKALEFYPKGTKTNNNLAWLLAVGAEPGFNDPAELVRLARTATEMSPEEGACWVTLGLAHYRAGDWAAAKAALAKPSNLSPLEDGARNLVLAMTEWQLGNQTVARTAYERALKRLAQDKAEPVDFGVSRLQAEAAQLLRVTSPAMKP